MQHKGKLALVLAGIMGLFAIPSFAAIDFGTETTTLITGITGYVEDILPALWPLFGLILGIMLVKKVIKMFAR